MLKAGSIFLIWIALPCFAENYLLNGGQESNIDYVMEQQIIPTSGIRKLIISYVIPQDFTSPSYNQDIKKFHITFSPDPLQREERTDIHGNRIMKNTWKNPREAIKITITLNALNHTNLEHLQTNAPFPLKDLPQEVRRYLSPTKQVPSDNAQIIQKTKELTASAQTEFDAVQQILTWMIDRMKYVLRPEDYGALYSLQTGRGNCQNYSHLAATLMRSVGIPVRIVNGITLKQPYDVKIKWGILTMRMAEGRHSWIEVYFPDLGWVPFDPQQMQLFVSNRFIRVEIGRDNKETINDGSIRWTRYRGTRGVPGFRETITAKLVSDRVQLSAERQNYGPRKMLFSPPVEAYFKEFTFAHEETAPPPLLLPENLNTLSYKNPVVFGNLDFPEGIDFIETRTKAQKMNDTTFVLHKNFIVETAEYVTTQGQKYAQTFMLNNPLQLKKVGLALHKFGGDGQLWVEIYKDKDSGKPGEYLISSKIVPLSTIKFFPGYKWIDFDFTHEKVNLAPGRYWIALGYTGSPIVNWFFSYGKPVGPADGTRYNTLFDENWSHSLAYEFNYRIVGNSAQLPK